MWTDNQAAFYSVLSGASGHPELNRIISLIWGSMARQGAQCHFDWVASEQNPADAPSRHAEPELPPSLLEQGWTLARDEPVIRASIRRTPATEDLLALTDV